MKLLKYFLISFFFSTAFCSISLYSAAFEDVAAHMATTNYEVHVLNCDNDDVFFETVVMNALTALQFPVKIKSCSSEDEDDDYEKELSNADILRLIYESDVEEVLDRLNMPVVPEPIPDKGITLKLRRSTIIIANDEKSLRQIIVNLQLRTFYPTHVQIVIASPDISFQVIQALSDSKFLHKFYFLAEDEISVKLLTFDWFTSEGCEDKQLVVVNEFAKSIGWTNENFEMEKFFDFHGCHIGVGVSQDHPASRIDRYKDSDGKEVRGDYEYHGYYVKMIEEVSKNLNFEFTFNPSISNSIRDGGLYLDNNLSAAFRIMSLGTERYLEFPHELYMTNAHAFVENYLLVPPGELYTDFEKFFLPFDIQTWICIVVVFVVAVAVIFVLGFFSESVQIEFYGIGVRYPVLNFFAHFFGIGQNVLPSKDFARITLMTYILFSLIVRTAYQSKMFEFLQQELRKPEIKTIDELIQRNFTIHVDDYQFFLIKNLDIFQK